MGNVRLTKFGAKLIATDCIVHWDVIPHKKNQNEPRGLNVLFADGHVSNCNNREIYAEELWNPTGDWDPHRGPGGNKEVFYEIIRLLNMEQ